LSGNELQDGIVRVHEDGDAIDARERRLEDLESVSR
jgi:hypothetical protein